MSGSAEETVAGPGASTTSALLDSRIVKSGETIGRYEVLEPLAEGAMGVVYRARDPDLDRVVALKLVHPRRADRAVDRERLHREAQAMAKLEHENVVRVLDAGVDAGSVFIAMELVEGMNLRQWLRRERPPWQRVLAAFLDAAQGLAAAHRAGIIHRDFKPENVMLGPDGRGRVLDFGLARALGGATDEDDLTPDHTRASESHGGDDDADAAALPRLGAKLTRTGAAIGTPAYMPPEQHLGRALDHRSDQFAFCVALYEGLYRFRPFRGDNVPELRAAITSGWIEAVPADSPVPVTIRDAILRGLSRKPGDRWPDMDALAHALRPKPKRRVGRVIALVAAGAIVSVGGGLWLASRHDRRCEAGSDRLAASWNDERKQALTAAIGAGERSFAGNVADAIASDLDDYAEAWRQSYAEVCARGDADALDQSMLCLEDRRRAFDTWLELLEEGGADAVEELSSRRLALPRIEPCLSPSGWASAPSDPAVAAAVEHAESDLDRGSALLAMGQESAAADHFGAALEQATQAGHASAIVRARYGLGRAKYQLGEFADARPLLEQTYYDAIDAGADGVAAEAAFTLAVMIGGELLDVEAGLTWADHARSQAERSGDVELMAMAERATGDIHMKNGNGPDAETAYRAAVASWEAIGDSERHEATVASTSLATALTMRGELDEAEVLLDAALAARLRRFGPDHPGNAQIHNALGYVNLRRARFDDAGRHFTRALALWRESLAPTHPNIAAGLNNVGEVAMAKGEWDAAADAFAEALAVAEQSLPPTHPRVAMIRASLGDIRREQERLPEAEVLLRRAIDDFEQGAGANHPELAHPLINLGRVLLDAGRPSEAVAPLQRALDVLQGGPDPHRIAIASLSLAKALRATGDLAGARGHAETAVEAFANAPEANDSEKAEAAAFVAAL